jgi:hypothetical protein
MVDLLLNCQTGYIATAWPMAAELHFQPQEGDIRGDSADDGCVLNHAPNGSHASISNFLQIGA